jgi:hypothetical protein
MVLVARGRLDTHKNEWDCCSYVPTDPIMEVGSDIGMAFTGEKLTLSQLFFEEIVFYKERTAVECVDSSKTSAAVDGPSYLLSPGTLVQQNVSFFPNSNMARSFSNSELYSKLISAQPY